LKTACWTGSSRTRCSTDTTPGYAAPTRDARPGAAASARSSQVSAGSCRLGETGRWEQARPATPGSAERPAPWARPVRDAGRPLSTAGSGAGADRGHLAEPATDRLVRAVRRWAIPIDMACPGSAGSRSSPSSANSATYAPPSPNPDPTTATGLTGEPSSTCRTACQRTSPLTFCRPGRR
jgi:hypothetical protein